MSIYLAAQRSGREIRKKAGRDADAPGTAFPGLDLRLATVYLSYYGAYFPRTRGRGLLAYPSSLWHLCYAHFDGFFFYPWRALRAIH